MSEERKDKEEPELALYSYWRSSCSWRVRIALHEAGLPFEYRAVHLVRDGGEQHGAAYVALNPAELVPTLALRGGARLTQSLAILEYLAETHAKSLLPTEPLARAHCRALVYGFRGFNLNLFLVFDFLILIFDFFDF